MSQSSGPVPQWNPPSHLTDPYVRRDSADRALWMRTMRGRIPKLHDRAVAMAFGTYGDSKGRDNYPGAATIAEDLCISESSAKRSLRWLAEHGWITRKVRGNRWEGKADVYHLSIPAPVRAEQGEWPATEPQWVERPQGEPKRPGVRDREAPKRQGKQHRQTPQPVAVVREIGVSNEGVGVNKAVDRGPSCDPPPEPYQIYLHHSDHPDRPHDTSRGSSHPVFDVEADDYDERLCDYLNERVDGMSPTTETMVLGMVSAGRAAPAVINAALKAEGHGKRDRAVS